MRAQAFIVAITLLCVAAAPSRADTDADLVEGIGTHVPDAFPDLADPHAPLPIDTFVDSVEYAPPVLVRGDEFSYLEVTGTISGRGWGGYAELPNATPFDPINLNLLVAAHYRYRVGFVLRWPREWSGETLVIHRHGFTSMSAQALAEYYLGPLGLNDFRHSERDGDRAVSDGVLSRLGAAYFCVNANGQSAEPGFVPEATYEEDGAGMDGIQRPLAGLPSAGLPPVHPAMAFDVPLARDTALVARRLLAKLAGESPETVVGVGVSAGSASLVGAVCGRECWQLRLDGNGWHTARSGGNFRRAYDPTSGLVFDAAAPISVSRPDLTFLPAFDLTIPTIDPEFPLTAPIAFLEGLADFAVMSHVLFANDIMKQGVDLRGRVQVVELHDIPHASSDMAAGLPNIAKYSTPPDSERIAPVVVAAVRNLVAQVADGEPLPESAMDPAPVEAPYVADARYDTLDPANRLFPTRLLPPDEVAAWSAVKAALGGGPALKLPLTSARLGGFDLPGEGATLTPFPLGPEPRTVTEIWGNYDRWRTEAEERVRELAELGLYDRRLGYDAVADPALRALFDR
jgi:hypothetical protein